LIFQSASECRSYLILPNPINKACNLTDYDTKWLNTRVWLSHSDILALSNAGQLTVKAVEKTRVCWRSLIGGAHTKCVDEYGHNLIPYIRDIMIKAGYKPSDNQIKEISDCIGRQITKLGKDPVSIDDGNCGLRFGQGPTVSDGIFPQNK
jgi:hypothetical protein